MSNVAAAAARAATLDLPAEQGAGGGADDGSRGAFAARVDRATDEGAAGGTDDQPGRAIGALAAKTALLVAPGPAVIAVVGQSGTGQRRNSESSGREGESEGAHEKLLVVGCDLQPDDLGGVLMNRSRLPSRVNQVWRR